MNRRAGDGLTERAHLEFRERQQQKRNPDYREPGLIGPPMPPAGEYLWTWFRRLHRRRRYGDSGPMPISTGDIRDWIDLHKCPLDPWEIEILEDLDDAYLGAVSEGRAAAMKQATEQAKKPVRE